MKTLDQPETCLDRSVEEIVVGLETAGSTGEISVVTVEIYVVQLESNLFSLDQRSSD